MKDRRQKKGPKHAKKADPLKKARYKYYIRLSAAFALALVLIGAGMFLYLHMEAKGYRDEYVAELKESMESSKDVCLAVLNGMGAEPETIDNINTQYENAMLEEDIFQQYYLVDGIMDYSLTSLYALINSKHQQVALNGGQWINYDGEIETLIETQAEMKAIKEQISSIDLNDYY